MKKLIALLMTLRILIAVTACTAKQEETASEETPPHPEEINCDSNPEDIKEYLKALKDRPDSEDDVFIINYDGIANKELWDEFESKVKLGEKAAVTVANFTIEGDTIYSYLVYDGESFKEYLDTTRDAFGKQDVYEFPAKYLYYIEWTTKEEVGEKKMDYLNMAALLSNTIYEAPDVTVLSSGDNDLITVWSVSEPVK